jgi:hypothetical protein
MPVVKFTNEDIKSSYLVQTPDWYDYEVTKVTEKPAKSDGSPNYWITFKGQSGEMEGVLVTKLYSSKAGWAMVPLIKAVNGGKEPVSDTPFELNDLVGVKVSSMTRRGDFNGTTINDLVDFRPVR